MELAEIYRSNQRLIFRNRCQQFIEVIINMRKAMIFWHEIYEFLCPSFAIIIKINLCCEITIGLGT
jgi:acetone carboxylase gamma subunit